ncbi:MAG: aminopeptidase N [Micrococcales bacterium]|nr:aminopeptidase N [Micrococcales bacterium]
MPGQNLTREEAAARAAIITDVAYDVELDLSGTGPTYRSRTTVSFHCTVAGASTWLDLIAPSVVSIRLNGRELDPAQHFLDSRIELLDLDSSNTVEVLADCAYMSSGEGLHRFVDPVDDQTYLYTQFEVADARRVYACFEQPDLKAPWQLTVEGPSHWVVTSNSPTPEPTEVRDGVSRWEFPATKPLSTYITALVAGPYHVVRDVYSGPHGDYPLGVFCRTSLAEHLDVDDILLVTKQGFEFFERVFEVPYAFGKYDQLFVPEFNAGAMENAGCVTLREDYVFRSRVTDAAYENRANTILHEMAHMWFGDLVTMRWWDDLWLNESFAEWASHYANTHATRFTDAWATFANQRKAWAYRQDQLPSTHPIAADMVDLEAVYVNFDGITYAKGASALRQLVAFVGEEDFLKGLRSYFAHYAWSNTSLNDLLTALADASGRDLSHWTQQWLQTSGVNMLQAEISLAPDGSMDSVTVVQSPPALPQGVAPTLRDHRIAIGLYELDGDLHRTDQVEVDVTGPRTQVPALAGRHRPDLLLLNDDDLTFAKIRLDEGSLSTVTGHFGLVADPLARALLWGATWDMTRDAEMSTRAFLETVASGLADETEVGMVQQVLRQADSAVALYGAPDKRDAYADRLAGLLESLARAAAPGSDHQLAYVRGLISFARTPEREALLQGLIDGTQHLDGLTVDTDLRWSLLRRLVVLGKAGSDAIDAEVARDDTAAGRLNAATCRAAIPTAEAKATAWDACLHDTSLPNHMLAATIAGIAVPDHRELMRPHVDAYFAALPELWRDRTHEIAQEITLGLYPHALVETATVERTDAVLQGAVDIPRGARRLLAEGRDGVLRSLRCQKRDGA